MNTSVELSGITRVRFGYFDLEYTHHESFTCFGRKWPLEMYIDHEEAAEGIVSVGLDNNSKKITDVIEVSLVVKDFRGNSKNPRIFTHNQYSYCGPGKKWTILSFESRSSLMDYRVNGNPVVEVHMKLLDPSDASQPFVPENSSACKVIQGMFMDEESADVMFEVGGQQKLNCNAKKKAKTLSVATFFCSPIHLAKMFIYARRTVRIRGEDHSDTNHRRIARHFSSPAELCLWGNNCG